MYCPRCGRQPIADELRFCSYCGFKLGVVKAALSDYEEASTTVLSDTRTLAEGPRHRDINIGVILVFVGAIIATFIAGRTTGGLGREVGALILAIYYLAIVLFSTPITKGILKLLSWEAAPGANFAASRKGMGFGATLMFLTTIILAVGSLLMFGRMSTSPFFIGLILAFALLLVICRHLMRGLQYLVTDDSTDSPQLLRTTAKTAGVSAFDGPTLQSAPEPVSVFGSQRVTTAEIVSPSSITEHTTNLLDTSKS
jgi:hypothetical protein